MSGRLARCGFTVRELSVVLIILVIGFAVAVPFLQRARERERLNRCFDKLRMLGITIQRYELGKRQYPSACFGLQSGVDAARDCRPADASGGKSTTAYSWIVAIHPYLNCPTLAYRTLWQSSQKFSITTGPFTPSLVDSAAPSQHFSCKYYPEFVCADWIGDGFTNSQTTIDVGPSCGAPAGWGAPEYATVDSGTPGTGSQSFKGKVAPTTYKPMVGTHMSGGAPKLNGGMALSWPGLTEGAISDGSSKTIFLCETKESSYASWYDGTLNWLVANDPNVSAPGSASDADVPPWVNARPALNRGFDAAVKGSMPYLKKSLTANWPLNDVWWGPSSNHASGVVSHVYGDGHTLGITDEADAELYLGLVTRSGSEPIDDTCCLSATATTGTGR